MNYIKKNGKLAHVRVVEEFIGRKLKKGEVIHHLNFQRDDNRIENLMLFSSQKEHKSFENKFKREGWTNPIRREVAFRWRKFKNV